MKTQDARFLPKLHTDYQKLVLERQKVLKLRSALHRIRRTSAQETFHGEVARFQEWIDAFIDSTLNETE